MTGIALHPPLIISLMLASSCGTQPSPAPKRAEVTMASASSTAVIPAQAREVASASAVVPSATQSDVPDGQIEADGSTRRIAFEGGESLAIEPVRITGRKPGVVAECAVRITGRVIVTIGEAGSKTEVFECHRLLALGAVPSDQGRRRLGLIYEAGTPNAMFRTPVVLTEQADSRWLFDEAAFERFEGTPATRSIRAMAKVLSDRQ